MWDEKEPAPRIKARPQNTDGAYYLAGFTDAYNGRPVRAQESKRAAAAYARGYLDGLAAKPQTKKGKGQ